MITYEKNPAIPTVPHMSDINDLFANFANNWYHLRFVLAVLFGLMFAFFLIKKLMKMFLGSDDD